MREWVSDNCSFMHAFLGQKVLCPASFCHFKKIKLKDKSLAFTSSEGPVHCHWNPLVLCLWCNRTLSSGYPQETKSAYTSCQLKENRGADIELTMSVKYANNKYILRRHKTRDLFPQIICISCYLHNKIIVCKKYLSYFLKISSSSKLSLCCEFIYGTILCPIVSR